MERQVIPWTTEEAWLKERVNDLTSSDISCLFGVGYQTYDELFESKKTKTIPNILSNERMEWGIALQDAIATELARKYRWFIQKKTEYIRIPSLKIGSSFDWIIIDQDKDRKCNGLLEIKNVSLDAYKKWIIGFEVEMSPYIEFQVQHQLLVSGLSYCIVGALISGCEGKLIMRRSNKKIQEAILTKAAEFWRKIDENNNFRH